MIYLVVTYAVFWALTFVFIFRISSSQLKLHRELEDIHRALRKREKGLER